MCQGFLNESAIDEALYRSLKIRFLLGLFDPIDEQPYWQIPPTAVNTNDSQALNLLLTLKAMVLLKNDNSTLPFSKGSKVAVVGPHANATQALVGNYLGK